MSHERNERVDPLTEADVRAMLDEAANFMQLVDSSDRPERATRYRPLNLSLVDGTEAATRRELIRARSPLCRGGARFQPAELGDRCVIGGLDSAVLRSK